MKKNLIKISVVLSLGILLSYNIQLSEEGNKGNVSLSYLKNLAFAFDEAGGSNCDLCVVEKWGVTLFSCKSDQTESCSATKGQTSVSCARAKEC